MQKHALGASCLKTLFQLSNLFLMTKPSNPRRSHISPPPNVFVRHRWLPSAARVAHAMSLEHQPWPYPWRVAIPIVYGATVQTLMSDYSDEKNEERRHVGFLHRLQASDRLKETLLAERGCFVKMKRALGQVQHSAILLPDSRAGLAITSCTSSRIAILAIFCHQGHCVIS